MTFSAKQPFRHLCPLFFSASFCWEIYGLGRSSPYGKEPWPSPLWQATRLLNTPFSPRATKANSQKRAFGKKNETNLTFINFNVVFKSSYQTAECQNLFLRFGQTTFFCRVFLFGICLGKRGMKPAAFFSPLHLPLGMRESMRCVHEHSAPNCHVYQHCIKAEKSVRSV